MPKPTIIKPKLSTPAILPAGYRRSFLFIGDSGTGKTTMAGTFPRPYFIDLDDGTSSLGPAFKDYERFREAPFKMKPRGGQHEYGKAWPAMYDALNKIGDRIDKKTWEFDTLVLDSLTLLQEIAMTNVLLGQGKPDSQFIDPGQWGGQMRAVEGIVRNINTWPGLKIFTAHVQRDKNDITGITEMLPLITGKLAGKIGIYFDEIYFLDVEGIGDARRHVIKTLSTPSMRQARSRMKVPDGADAHFSSIWPYLEPYQTVEPAPAKA